MIELTLAQTLFVFFLFVFFTATIIANGVIRERENSRERLRKHFDQQGEAGEPAREMMRDAGYDV